jgi:hypothetical protein
MRHEEGGVRNLVEELTIEFLTPHPSFLIPRRNA